jgi:superfamily I DNA/RNA helicase
LTAVLGWETLRKGQQVPFSVVKTIYKYLDPSFILRGHKGLRTADHDALYAMSDLRERYGLQTEALWHEVLTKISEDRRRYIISLLRRGVKLSGKAPIRLSTIHGAKGGEADNVLLISDLTTKFSLDYERDSDSVNRLLYVGVTRARQSLHIVMPKNVQKGFRL